MFPTLIAVSYQNEHNKNVMSSEVNPLLLVNYLKEQQNKLNELKKSELMENKNASSSTTLNNHNKSYNEGTVI